MQSELLLPIPLGPRTYHGELQEPRELFGPVGSRRKVEAPSASLQWSLRLDSPGTSKKCCPEATRRDDQ